MLTLEEAEQRAALDAVIAYGAVILTFLGAVHWGLALRIPRNSRISVNLLLTA
mgnify:CR=1 FL=1